MAGFILQDFVADINYLPAKGIPIDVEQFIHPRLGIREETTRSVTIHDARNHNEIFNLDKNGFEFIVLPPKERNIENDGVISRELYPELEGQIKQLTGASLVFIFSHSFRLASNPENKGKLDGKGRPINTPSAHPHVDYSGMPEHIAASIKELIHLGVPSEVSKQFETCYRFSFVNAWRPLKVVKKDPLVLADATTVPDSDYQVRNRHFRSGIKSANYVMSHGASKEQHQWYYLSEMQPDEVVIFKNFDTKQDLPGWRCPHTAVVLPGTENLPARESIEFRAVCFWH